VSQFTLQNTRTEGEAQLIEAVHDLRRQLNRVVDALVGFAVVLEAAGIDVSADDTADAFEDLNPDPPPTTTQEPPP
jgi:CHAD domain-containing protein